MEGAASSSASRRGRVTPGAGAHAGAMRRRRDAGMQGGEASTDARGLLIEGIVLYPELAGDGVLKRPVGDGAIWIESGTIRAIGPREALRAAAGTGLARLDGQGALAVPGLVDSHIHLG